MKPSELPFTYLMKDKNGAKPCFSKTSLKKSFENKLKFKLLLIFISACFAANSQNNAIFGGGISNGFGTNCGSGAGSLAPLPIQLISFEAEIENNTVLLKWTTASEINNEYFTIESSLDGFTWNSIGTVSGAGNSTAIINYSFREENNIAIIKYYRLKQTDFNGMAEYSKTIRVRNNAENFQEEISVFPNPSSGIFKLEISGPKELYNSLIITDQSGKIILSFNTFQTIIDLSDQASGVYYINYNFNAKAKSQKIVLLK